MYNLYCSHKLLCINYLWNAIAAVKPSFVRGWTLYITSMNSFERPFESQKSLEHSQGAMQPPPDNASVLGRAAQSDSKTEESIWWRGKY